MSCLRQEKLNLIDNNSLQNNIINNNPTKMLEFHILKYCFFGYIIKVFDTDIENKKKINCSEEDRELINEYSIISINIPILFDLPLLNNVHRIYLINYTCVNNIEEANIETRIDVVCSDKSSTDKIIDYKLKIQDMFIKKDKKKELPGMTSPIFNGIISKHVERIDDIYEILQFFEKQKNNEKKYQHGCHNQTSSHVQIYFIIDINSKGQHGSPIILTINKYNHF